LNLGINLYGLSATTKTETEKLGRFLECYEVVINRDWYARWKQWFKPVECPWTASVRTKAGRTQRAWSTRKAAATLAVVMPFDVVGPFGVALGLAVDQNSVRLDPAIGGQHNSAIPHSLRCLDPLGEIDLAVHRVTPSLKTVSSVGITDS
jgi:hypothetical protein